MFSNVPVEKVTVVAGDRPDQHRRPVDASPHMSGKGAVNRIGVHAPPPQIG
jgi:hypothetical protein